MRIFLKSLGVLVGLILLYSLIAWIGSSVGVNNEFTPTENGVDIFLRSNGVHTDIVIPVQSESMDWRGLLENPEFSMEHYRYLGFGWGDKGFYLETPTWADLRTSVAVNAILLPSGTAMHVSGYRYPPDLGEKCKSVRISAQQLSVLEELILESFRKDSSANVMQIGCCGYGKYDRFFEANGNYHLFQTCNGWTNDMLKESGLPAAWWTPFESGVLRHYSE